MLNIDLWAWPHLWPQGHDLKKLESSCPKDALYEISNLCQKKIFNVCKSPHTPHFSPLVAQALHMNKSEPPPPNDASPQIWSKLVQPFLKM